MSQYFLYLAYMVAGVILTVLFTVAYVLITPALCLWVGRLLVFVWRWFQR